MRVNINNSEELKNELVRLCRLRKEQEMYLGDQYTFLKHKLETPSRVVGAIASTIPGVDMVRGLFSSMTGAKKDKNEIAGKSDWLTRATQIGLPFILNRTLLKNSGWLKKSLVLLASEGAAGQVTQDKVSTFIGRIADYVRPKNSKKKHKNIQAFQDSNNPVTGNPDLGVSASSEIY